MVRLKSCSSGGGRGSRGGEEEEEVEEEEEFYFRWEVDILYLGLEGKHVRHFDDSPEVGFLAHFRDSTIASSSSSSSPIYYNSTTLTTSAKSLRTIAITRVIQSGLTTLDSGSLSNVLRDFPHIERIIMMVPDGSPDIFQDHLPHPHPHHQSGGGGGGVEERVKFARAARRIVFMYEIDTGKRAGRWRRQQQGDDGKSGGRSGMEEGEEGQEEEVFEVDFAVRKGRELEVVPREVWREWVTVERQEGFSF